MNGQVARYMILAELAKIAEAIDNPPRRWRLWPWPRRVAAKADTLGSVMRAMRGATRAIDDDEWAVLWRHSTGLSVRARVTIISDVRLVENQMGLTRPEGV